MVVRNNHVVSAEHYFESPEYAFVSTMLWMSRWFGGMLAPFGLVGAHFHALARLDQTPGLTQSELGEQIHRDAPATSRVIDDLRTKGLVETRVDPHDRRRRRVFMTAGGQRMFHELHEGFQRARREAGIDLASEDIDALWRVAGLLQAGYRAALEDQEDLEETG